MSLCELCGDEYVVKPGRGANNRVTCYSCTSSPESRSPHHRNKHLKRAYGINYHEFLKLHEQQGGCCSICGSTISTEGIDLRVSKKRLRDEPCVDHCHTTGKVRGLLCFHCNTALGHVFDDPKIIDNMKAYLLRNGV